MVKNSKLIFSVRPTASSIQTGKIMAYTKLVDQHYGQNYGRTGKSGSCIDNNYFHLCRDGNAAFRQKL